LTNPLAQAINLRHDNGDFHLRDHYSLAQTLARPFSSLDTLEDKRSGPASGLFCCLPSGKLSWETFR
jgi:hypothetical protein